MTITTVQVDTFQVVYSDDARTPLIGMDSPDGEFTFTPWSWDEKIWTSEYFDNVERTIRTPGDQTPRGIPEEYWQCGVGNIDVDLEVLDPIVVRQESADRWTVKINHGNYFKYHESRRLFPDRSYIQFVDYAENESSRNVLQLDEIPKFNSDIRATMWMRDSLNEPVLYRNIQKRMQFTGIYDDDGETDTQDDDGDIVWANVDDSKREFVVVWPSTYTTAPKLYFNTDYTFLEGRTTVSDADDLTFCDHIGTSLGSTEEQIFYTKYFPVMDNAEFKIYKYDGSTITLMVEDTDYVMDFDRGEITFPDPITPPDSGDEVYAVYRPTIEVEYEPETCNNYLTASLINMNPMNSVVNRGFIYLTEEELRVAYVTLEADTTEISTDIYGPLYLGADYCFLIATAYNIHDQPVPGAEISFYLGSEDDGRLNGALATDGDEITAITNSDGQARVIYTSPRSVESVGQYLAHENGGADAQYELNLIHYDGITSDNLDTLYVYQVFADDSMQPWYNVEGAASDEAPGTGGRKVILYHRTVAAELGGGVPASTDRFAGDSDTLHPRTGLDGSTTDVWMPLRPAEISGGTLTFKDSGGSNVNLPWTEEPPGDWTVSTAYVTNNKVWQVDTSKWYICLGNHTSSTADEPGVGTNWETYWAENANAGNIVAYWVSGGKRIDAYAKCYSYLYNNWIDSNDIQIDIDIPEHLQGVYVNDDSKEIPYGFRLYDDYYPASGLAGATFLSIHPAAGKWPVIWDGSALGEIADPNPFGENRLGNEFTVTIS